MQRLAGILAAAAALAVRLGVVPAWERHLYDGHEAEYLAFFLGERVPAGGDTILYPAMQRWWWLWGLILPADPRIPVVLSALVGVAGAAAAAGAVGVLAGRRAGWMAAAVLALHPAHAAWSSSAYNVALPHALGSAAVLAAALACRDPRRRWPYLAGAALALAAGCRLESAIFALPVAGLALLADPSPRKLARWAPPAALGALLALLLLAPLRGGELPGADERALSFSINAWILDYFAPFHAGLGLIAALAGAALAVRRWPRPSLALLPLAPAAHLLLATFDDYGERHALVALPALAWAVGAGAASGPAGWAVLGLALAAEGSQLIELRRRYYATEESFEALLAAPPWDALPRIEAPPAECGLLAEDPRIAADPPRSHFNALDPAEEAGLRGPGGCLAWCLDVQDWRWSSRGVRDRAIRLARLFPLEPAAVVIDPTSGYPCLMARLGARRRGPALLRETLDGYGRGTQADPPIP